MLADTTTRRLARYVPSVALEMLARGTTHATRDGTLVYADVSGFTRLTERLARTGHEGAEHLVDIIDGCFTPLLDDAYAAGGSLLKFGGDALLLWFAGADHAARACDAALTMRATLRRIGRIRAGATRVVLRMSVGIHSGDFHFFLVGGSHREFLIAGPAATSTVAMEAAATAGQVLVSHATAAALPRRCLGLPVEIGVPLARAPGMALPGAPSSPRVSDALAAQCFSAPMREHVIGQDAVAEHRLAAIAFVQFGAFDAVVDEHGPETAATALDQLVRVAQEAATRYGVCFLGSDIGDDGGRFLLSAGAPRALGDDEERMLLCLREIVDNGASLPVSAGVTRGHVFAAELGPPYRRAYALMGDTTNVAARLSGKAPFGHIYASRDLPERLTTHFHLVPLAPLTLKGKRRPLTGWDIGQISGATPLTTARPRPPLIGRDLELTMIRNALREARGGSGALVEVIGETGSGKSRLLSEARRMAAGMRQVHTTCQVYTRETPYAGAGDALRQLLGIRVDADDATVVDALRTELSRRRPDLTPWLPLLVIAFGASTPLTPEIEQLAPDVRERKLQQTVFAFFEPELRIPTLFQVEHTHVIDAASAGLLRALGRELYATSWLLIATRRDVEGAFGLEDPHPCIVLEPLTAAQTLELARATPEAERVPPHVLELAVARSAGSPEFLLDLLAAAAAGNRETLPESVEAAAGARLDMLSPHDRRLVCRAAVLGMSFEPERLAEVLDAGFSAPDHGWWRRMDSVFALDPGGLVRFKRPAVQEAAYASLPYKLRRSLHGRVARALERSDPAANLAPLSHHWSASGDPARAFAYAIKAAEQAQERFSHADAAALYRRALDAGQAAGLGRTESGREVLAAAWEGHGESLRRIGEPQAAMRSLSAARRLVGTPQELARLLYSHAEVAARNQDGLSSALRWSSRGLRALQDGRDVESRRWRARLWALRAGVRQRQGHAGEAVRLCRQAIAEGEAAGDDPAIARACYVLDWALLDRGEAVGEHSKRALALYRALGDLEQESAVLNNLGMFAYFAGRWDDAVELYGEAALCSRRAGRPADAAYTDCNIGEILSDQGNFAAARTHFTRAVRVWRSTGEAGGAAFAQALLGRVALREGSHDEGMTLLTEAAATLHRLQLRYAELAEALIAEGHVLRGQPHEALDAVERLGHVAVDLQPLVSRVRGLALLMLGDRDEAAAELRRGLAAASARQASYESAVTIRALELTGDATEDELDESALILERLNVVAVVLGEVGEAELSHLRAV